MEVYVRCPKGHRQQYRDVEFDLQTMHIVYACPHCRQVYKKCMRSVREEEEEIKKEEEKKDVESSVLHKVPKESTSEGRETDILQQRNPSGEGAVRGLREQGDKDTQQRGKDIPKGETK